MKALLTLLAVCMFASSVFAQGGLYPMSFQGKLVDTGGNPIDSSGISITFKLYKDNTEIWTETQSVNADSGVFNVYLGADTPLDTVAFNQPIELGITLDGEGSEMVPRTLLASAAFALGVRGMYAWYADDETWAGYNIVGGASVNSVGSDAIGATIAGGGGTLLGGGLPNVVNADFGFIGGGISNSVSDRFSAVVGGSSNTANGQLAFVGGGQNNAANEFTATVAGGQANNAIANMATIGGGQSNTASGQWSTIAGGNSNDATAEAATVAGGDDNVAEGIGASVPGGHQNRASGEDSFAAGFYARANHEGAFVWNDRDQTGGTDSLYSTDVNQFIIGAAGGVGIGTNEPEAQLHIQLSDLDVDDTEKSDEGILLEAQDAILGLYSSNAGDWGSGISMAHMVNDTLRNKWAIIRETLNIGSDLHFKFGTNQAHHTNPTRFEITNDGPVISHGIRPFSDGVSSSGTASRQWLDIFTVNAVTVSSDRRLKQDIEEISGGLELINALRPVRYRWKSYPDRDPMIGLIAQEVEPYVPEAVRAPDADSEFYGMQYEQLVPLLIKAVQEQNELITRQQGELTVQAERIAALERRLVP